MESFSCESALEVVFSVAITGGKVDSVDFKNEGIGVDRFLVCKCVRDCFAAFLFSDDAAVT